MRSVLFVIAALTLSSSLFAQHKNQEETVAYIDEKLGPEVEVTVKKDIVSFVTSENGKEYKFEKVIIMDINPGAIEYSEEEGGVILRCTGEPCVERKIPKKKLKGGYNRMIIDVPGGEAERNAFINAVRHLIMVTRDPNYRNDRSFEE